MAGNDRAPQYSGGKTSADLICRDPATMAHLDAMPIPLVGVIGA
jgi:hypothetical protein